jgi:hypothetical protein
MAFGYLDALTMAASLAAGTVTANPAVAIGTQAALSGGKTYLQGGNAEQIAQSAAISGASAGAGQVAGAVGSELGGEVGKVAAPMAMNAGIGALRGESAEQIGEGAAMGLASKGIGAGIASIRDPNTNSGNAAGGPPHPLDQAMRYAMGGRVRRRRFEEGGGAEGGSGGGGAGNDGGSGSDGGGGGSSGGGGGSASEGGGGSASEGGGPGGGGGAIADSRGSDVNDRAGSPSTGASGASDNYGGSGGGYAVDTNDPANTMSGGVAGITGNAADLNADDPGINSGTMQGGAEIGFGNIGAGGAEMGLANGVSAAATDDFGSWGNAKDFAPAPVSGGAFFGGTPNYDKEQGTDGGRGSEGGTSSGPGDMPNAPAPAPTTPPGQTQAPRPTPTVHIPTVSDLVRPGTINPDSSAFGYSPPRYLAGGGRVGLQEGGGDWYDVPYDAPASDSMSTYAPADLSSTSPVYDGGYTGGYYP